MRSAKEVSNGRSLAEPTESQRDRRTKGPLTGKGQNRKIALLAAARAVFERDGFLAARVADIVDEAQVSQGTFYTYFDSKEGVFREVARLAIEEMVKELHAEQFLEDPMDRIPAALTRYIRAYRANARIIALIEQVGSFTPEMRQMRLDIREAFVERSERGIRRLQTEGQADPGISARAMAELLGNMVDHTCYVWMTLKLPYNEKELLQTLTTIWARAIGVQSYQPGKPLNAAKPRTRNNNSKATARR